MRSCLSSVNKLTGTHSSCFFLIKTCRFPVPLAFSQPKAATSIFFRADLGRKRRSEKKELKVPVFYSRGTSAPCDDK
ncbi:MAG: hypothetical protein D3906_07755 [Candidatus Electrothrix sp. AUS1_2]|nr:hypothetical protein [Candidatus Electrothrix sp. AUS1_2]